jgi:imidazolonepropionase-like amidohydrolase
MHPSVIARCRGSFPRCSLLVDSVGLLPLQAIRTATLNGALALGKDDSLGTVTAAKIADLVVLRGDPSRNIRNTQTITMVVKGGRMYVRKNPMRIAPFAKPPAS